MEGRSEDGLGEVSDVSTIVMVANIPLPDGQKKRNGTIDG